MQNSIHSPKLRNVKITDKLFGHYVSLVSEKILPYQWEILNDRVPGALPSHCIENFRIAAGEIQGERKGVVFLDTDAYKWLEALAYCLESGTAKQFEPIADELIELIGKAQEPDGYLDTYYSLLCPEKKWSNLLEGHELYCAGHMIEAAVAYFRATGKKQFMEIAMRFADLIYSHFVTDGIDGYPGHEEIELALVKLYKATGKETYLELAKHFLDVRGKEPNYLMGEMKRNERLFPEFVDFDAPYAQSQCQPAHQETAEGHAVRVVYLCSAMADIARECNDAEMEEGCKRLWKNVTERRMYITGGIGSSGYLERFTTDYDLPNDRMYCESCASVGMMMFGQRMNTLTHDARYYEIVERVLCNGVLAGISKEGDRYFYVNPLEVWPANCLPGTSMAHVKPVRQPWYDVACCPTNIARTLASLGQYIYAEDDNGIYINQFISSSLNTTIGGAQVALTIAASLFDKNSVEISFESQQSCDLDLHVRIPDYMRDAVIRRDGKEESVRLENGYAVFHITEAGTHSFNLSGKITPVFMAANENVRADIGRLALQYGPFLYCLEEEDNGKNLASLFVDQKTEVVPGKPAQDLPGSFPTLNLNGKRLNSGIGDKLYGVPAFSLQDQKLTAVPYCLWGNRTYGEMLVWMKALI